MTLFPRLTAPSTFGVYHERDAWDKFGFNIQTAPAPPPKIAFSALSPALRLGAIRRNRLGYYAKRVQVRISSKIGTFHKEEEENLEV